jgi:hypothetical protein
MEGWTEERMVELMVELAASTYIRCHRLQLSAPDGAIPCSTLTIDPFAKLSDPTCEVP